jgi:DNA-binding MarR family transcriptional regulator
MIDNTVLGTFDKLELIARRYNQFFPEGKGATYLAHLAIAGAGNAITSRVERYLGSQYGINRARYSLLRALYFSEDHMLAQNELARTLNVTSPNVTQLIDALEREGLVERISGDTDRRVTFARLTPAGEARCEELVPAMAAFIIKTCEGLSDEELESLARILTKFCSNLDRVLD